MPFIGFSVLAQAPWLAWIALMDVWFKVRKPEAEPFDGE